MIVYLVTLLCLQVLLRSIFSEKVNNLSITQITYYILKYSTLKNLFITLFITLIGIPPFILFFLKFNYLIEILSHSNFFVIVLIFLLFFLNMLYYAQIFLIKNIKSNNFKIKSNKTSRKSIFYIVFILNFFFLSIFFINDIILFFSLFI